MVIVKVEVKVSCTRTKEEAQLSCTTNHRKGVVGSKPVQGPPSPAQLLERAGDGGVVSGCEEAVEEGRRARDGILKCNGTARGARKNNLH